MFNLKCNNVKIKIKILKGSGASIKPCLVLSMLELETFRNATMDPIMSTMLLIPTFPPEMILNSTLNKSKVIFRDSLAYGNVLNVSHLPYQFTQQDQSRSQDFLNNYSEYFLLLIIALILGMIFDFLTPKKDMDGPEPLNTMNYRLIVYYIFSWNLFYLFLLTSLAKGMFQAGAVVYFYPTLCEYKEINWGTALLFILLFLLAIWHILKLTSTARRILDDEFYAYDAVLKDGNRTLQRTAKTTKEKFENWTDRYYYTQSHVIKHEFIDKFVILHRDFRRENLLTHSEFYFIMLEAVRLFFYGLSMGILYESPWFQALCIFLLQFIYYVLSIWIKPMRSFIINLLNWLIDLILMGIALAWFIRIIAAKGRPFSDSMVAIMSKLVVYLTLVAIILGFLLMIWAIWCRFHEYPIPKVQADKKYRQYELAKDRNLLERVGQHTDPNQEELDREGLNDRKLNTGVTRNYTLNN